MVRSSLFLLMILTFNIPAPAQFEGEMRMRVVNYMDGDSAVVHAVLSFSGDNLAAVVHGDEAEAGGGGKYILKGDKKVLWIISDRERLIVEIPLPEPAPTDPGGEENPPEVGDTLQGISRTGLTATVAGYSCEEWIADDGDGSVTTIMATRELGDSYRQVVEFFDRMSDESAVEGQRWERDLASMSLFPMRVVRMEDDEITETEEVISIEKKKIPASLFDAPAGYEMQVLDLNYEEMFEKMIERSDRENGAGIDSIESDGAN